MRALVIGLRRYDFKDDDGERVKGMNMFYVMPEGSSDEDTVGFLPVKERVSQEAAKGLGQVPGYYELYHEMRPGRDSRPTPTLASMTFEGPAEVGTTPAPSEQAS